MKGNHTILTRNVGAVGVSHCREDKPLRVPARGWMWSFIERNLSSRHTFSVWSMSKQGVNHFWSTIILLVIINNFFIAEEQQHYIAVMEKKKIWQKAKNMNISKKIFVLLKKKLLKKYIYLMYSCRV